MLLQCLKCSLFYRSFSKLKTHKSLGPCADKIKPKKKVENLEEISKADDLAKSIHDTKINDVNATLEENLNEHIKTEPTDHHIKEEYPPNIKLEPEETLVKEQRLDIAGIPASLSYYEDAEEYVPAPIVVIDSDDEYEPESDDSAPDDDDIEAVKDHIDDVDVIGFQKELFTP